MQGGFYGLSALGQISLMEMFPAEKAQQGLPELPAISCKRQGLQDAVRMEQ